MIHIPFDYIKVLENGTYGCTLKLGKQIFCAVYSPKWEVVELLHKVDEDPYQDFTYFRDDTFEICSYYCNGELHTIDKDLIELLDVDTEYQCSKIDIEDFILQKTTNDSLLLLFSVRYMDRNDNVAFVLNDTLAPFSTIRHAAMKFVLDKYIQCQCNVSQFAQLYGLDSEYNTPIQNATLGLAEWIDCVCRSINNLYNSKEDCNVVEKLATFECYESDFVKAILKTNLYMIAIEQFPSLIYKQYLTQISPEIVFG